MALEYLGPLKGGNLEFLGPLAEKRATATEADVFAPPMAEGTSEGIASLATGAMSWIPAGISMITPVTAIPQGGVALRSPSEMASTARAIQESLTYEPKTETGRKIAEVGAYPFAKLAELGEEGKSEWYRLADEARAKGDEKTAKAYELAGLTSGIGGEALPFIPGIVKPVKMGLKKVQEGIGKVAKEGIRVVKEITKPREVEYLGPLKQEKGVEFLGPLDKTEVPKEPNIEMEAPPSSPDIVLPDGLTMKGRRTDQGIVVEAIDKNGKVVGKAEAGEYWDGVFSPDGIQVDPAYQRKGVASILYDSFPDFIPEGTRIDYRNADIFTGEGKLFKNAYDNKRGFSGETLTHEQTAVDYVPSSRDVVLSRKNVGVEAGKGAVGEAKGAEPAMAFEPAKDFERRTPEGSAEPTTPIKRSDIVKFLQEKFDVPLRVGRFRVPGALGIFKVKPEVIRTRMANDIEVISHEIGHGINKYMWGMDGKYLNVKPLEPFAAELLPLATKAAGKQPPIQEGFAEFLRLYVTNEVQARNKAPKFYEFLEKEFSDKLPEAQNILLEARDQFNKWATQPFTQRVLAQLSIGKKEKTPYTFKKAYTQWVDELHPLKKAVEEMSRNIDDPLSAAKDPYKLARLMEGWTGKADAFLEHNTFDFKSYANKGKSLHDILKPVESDINNLRAYLVSKHSKELNKRGFETGILPEDASKVIAEQEGKFDQPAKEIWKYQDDVLQYLADSGVIGKKDLVRLRKAYQSYVPFYRVMESPQGGGMGKGLETGKPIHGMKGSWSDIVDPLESIVKNTYTFIQAAEKNTVLKTLVDFANSREGMGKFVEKIPTPLQKIVIREPELLGILQKYGKWTETTKYRETQRTVGEKIRNINEAGQETTGGGTRASELMEQQAMDALKARGRSENEARTILEKIKKAPIGEVRTKIIEREIEKLAVRETVREFGLDMPNDMVEIFRPSAFTPKDGVITVWRNGKREFYQLEPELARAIQALDKESTNTLIKILSYPARWLRAGATLTPEFILRNPLRDQFSAFVYSKHGFIPGYDLIKGIFHIAKGDELYWNWKKSGGEHSMLVSMDREYLQKGLEQVLAGKNVKTIAKSIVTNPLRAMQILSEFTEEGTRIGEFGKSLKGKEPTKASIIEGGFESREVTLDFNRKGTAGRAANQLIAFWNANIQGMDKMIRSFKENPVSATVKVISAITLPSVLLYMVNRDDPRWKEIPQWQKDLFWIVFTKRISSEEWNTKTIAEKQDSLSMSNIVRIPKPFELGIIFGSVPERILEYVDNNNPRLFSSLAKSVMAGASPSFIPTAATPLLENWANKSFFMDRPIVSRGREQVQPAYQYQPYTTELAKSMGKIVDKISGGATGSPAKIENLIRGWSGGIGMYALNIADKGLRMAGILPEKIEPTKTPADYPVLKAFIVRYPSSDAESIREFYDNYEKTSQLKNTVMALAKKEFKPKEAMELYSSEVFFPMDKAQKAMTNAQTFIQMVNANPKITPNNKRQLIDNAYIQMIAMAQQANKTYSDFKQRQLTKK